MSCVASVIALILSNIWRDLYLDCIIAAIYQDGLQGRPALALRHFDLASAGPMADTGTASKHLGQRRVAPKGLSRRPRLYLIGEAPGAEEAEQGRPFVGPAGSALRKMLEQARIDARRLRMANAIPFRPVSYFKDRKPGNRTPTA